MKKNQKCQNKIIENFYNISCIMAISKNKIISCKFKEGGYDNFSFKIFMEETIKSL